MILPPEILNQIFLHSSYDDINNWKDVIDPFIYTQKQHKTLIDTVKAGNLIGIKYHISCGADIRVKDDYALRYSAENGHIDVVKYLVELGTNIHAVNDLALIWSAQNGQLDVVKYLVGLGANIHACNYYALRQSAWYGHFDVVKYLAVQILMML